MFRNIFNKFSSICEEFFKFCSIYKKIPIFKSILFYLLNIFYMKSRDQILLEEAYSLVLEKKRKKKSKKRTKDRSMEKGILGGYWGNDSVGDGGDGGEESRIY